MKSSDLELVFCLGFTTAGKRLPEVVSFPCPDLLIYKTVNEALQQQKLPDAPSGTARELAYLLGQIGQSKNTIPPDQVHGDPGTRRAEFNGTQVHSIRIPGFYSTVETVFGLPGERVSIRHDSISYVPYVEGTLMAVKKVVTMRGLVRGMNDFLGLATDLH